MARGEVAALNARYASNGKRQRRSLVCGSQCQNSAAATTEGACYGVCLRPATAAP